MKRIIVLAIFYLLLSAGVYSAQNGFEVMSFSPATDDGRYLSVWDSHILDKGEWFFGTTFDYSYRPLQMTINEQRESGILDKVFEQHLYSSVGIIQDRLELGIDIPIGWWLDYKNENKTSLGDVLLNAKVSLLNMKRSGVGLSVSPFISLPTGKSDYFFGNGVVTAGADLIAEVNPIKKVFVAMNVGLLAKKDYTLRDINDTSKLTGGLGVAVAATKDLNISADLLFKTRLSGIFREKAETPVELLTGVKYAIANTGFTVNGAVGGGLINGGSAPAYRALFGLGYDLSSGKGNTSATEKEEVTDKTQEPLAGIVHFTFNSIKVEKSPETVNLDELAKALHKDKTKKLLIEGNADNIGSKAVNDRISKQRADAVAKYIGNHGVARTRMTIRSYGSENPIEDNNTKEGRYANRRVEIRIQEN
jgi:outer membrane protein OmpA-like peptidoglycan-associated protein